MANEASQHIKQLKEIAPGKPWFVYYVPGTTHAPHHPRAEGFKKISELHLFDEGWKGMIVTQGGHFSGYALFLSHGEFALNRGRMVLLYNLLNRKRTIWEGQSCGAASTPSSSSSGPMSRVVARAARFKRRNPCDPIAMKLAATRF
jgi:hypothetical protein